MINQVLPKLYIGNSDAVAEVADSTITDVIQLHVSPPTWPAAVTTHVASIPDGKPVAASYLQTQVATIKRLHEQDATVLVACAAGISRSSMVTLAYLASSGYTLPDAYRHLLSRHPIADPHPALWESLLDFLNVEATWLDIMQWRIEGKQ